MLLLLDPRTPCLGTRLVKCVTLQLKSVSAEPGNVPSLHSRAVRNVDAQSLPSIAPEPARLLSGVAAVVLLLAADAVKLTLVRLLA